MLNTKLLDKLDALEAKFNHLFQFEYYKKISKNYLIHPQVLNAIGLY